MESLIAVIAEHSQGRGSPVTYEAIACAREIQRVRPSNVVVLAIGENAEAIAGEIAETTACSVIAAQVPGLEDYNSDAYRTVIGRVLDELRPAFVCVPGTLQGLDFAPGLAVRIGTSCISGIERVLEKDGEPIFTRTLFNGKIVAELASSAMPTMLIVQPGAFKQALEGVQNLRQIEVRTIDWKPTHTRSLGFKITEIADSALGEASVIVSAGRGVGRRENLELMRQVASLFSRSVVAASRPLCDLGWFPYQLQVGQTGATVTPDLYFACGISGAQQHIAGMKGSKFVVAVNTDPNAAIFNEADIGIVEDLEGFLLDLIEESTS